MENKGPEVKTESQQPIVEIKLGSGQKLSHEKQKYRLEICKMLALGYNPSLVSQEMKDQFGVRISRQSVRVYYQRSAKMQKTIQALRDRAAKELMAHPLADKKTRLNYLLRALNHALTWGTDKLYFDKDSGKLLGKVEKVQIGIIPALIKEAREEIEGIKINASGLKLSLVTIIKNVTEKNKKDGRIDFTTTGRLGPDSQGDTDPVGAGSLGDIEVL